MSKPDRELVHDIASEEAARVGAKLSDVLGMSRRPLPLIARREAWKRIADATGCSDYALAKVWGCDRQAVSRAATPPAVPEPYDTATAERLRWQHGDERAAHVMRGQDPNTNHDIAAWRRLCALGGAA